MARVLVVDDERGLRITMRQCLLDAGHDVDAAETAREPLDLIDARADHVVALDIILPADNVAPSAFEKAMEVLAKEQLRQSQKMEALRAPVGVDEVLRR